MKPVILKTTHLLTLALIGLSTSLLDAQAAPSCTNNLESHYSTLPSWLSQKQKSTGLDMSCIEHSMTMFAGWAQTLGNDNSGNEGIFISCSEEATTRSSLPQCQTPSYMNTTLNTFNSVTDCLDIKVEDLFPIIAAESGFYHNSVSNSLADFGFGQVTDPAIFDVNTQWYAFIDQMKASPKKSCQNVASFIQENDLQPVDKDYQCSLTTSKSNPLLNAIYSGIHYKIITGYLDDYAQRSHLQKRVENILGKNFTLERYSALKSILTILSYNLGHNGTVEAFEDFMSEKAHSIYVLTEERREVGTKLARINLKLLSNRDDQALVSKKLSLFEEIRSIDQQLESARQPNILNGVSTPGSFGGYLTKKKLSAYLNILKRRVDNIARVDQGNLCPTKQFLRVD